MRALFFGLGGVGQRHLRNLRRLLPDVELGAVRSKGRVFEIGDDLVPDHGTDIVQKYGLKVFSSFDKALAFSPDLAVVSNPTSLHVETAARLLRAKVPLLLEKPVSDGPEGLEELRALSEAPGAVCMVGYMMRFHPCAERLKKLLDEGALGRVQYAAAVINSYMPSWHKYEKYNEFYAGMRALGGGAVLTEIHELDLLHWFFGTPSRVWAAGGSLGGLDIDVEDTAASLLEFDRGDARFPVSLSVSFAQRAPVRRLQIFGDRGWADWDISGSRLAWTDAVSGKREEAGDPAFPRNELFVAEMRHFLDCLRTGEAPRTALAKVLDGHRTALRIRDMVRGGDGAPGRERT